MARVKRAVNAQKKRRVVLEREASTLVREIVERASLHRLADLALHEALPGRADLQVSVGRASDRTHARRVPPVAIACADVRDRRPVMRLG